MPAHACGRSFAGMTSRILSLALAGAVVLSAAPAADAKKKPKRMSATYMTTITVDYASKWQYRQFAQHECLPGVCSREDKGNGSTTAHMETKRPFPVWSSAATTAARRRSTSARTASRWTGEQIVQGTDTTTYGGPWAAANPNRADETTGCGRRTLDDFGSIGWAGQQRAAGPAPADIDPFREDCPLGPGPRARVGGRRVALIQDVVASVGKGKFLGTKQFTVRGAKRLKALMPDADRVALHPDPATPRRSSGRRRSA